MNKDNQIIKIGLLAVALLSSISLSAEELNLINPTPTDKINKTDKETPPATPRQPDKPTPNNPELEPKPEPEFKPNDKIIFESLVVGSQDKKIADKLIINADLPESIIVKNSYIVSFKEEKEDEITIVGSANKVQTDSPMPFGAHSSGQDKEALAASINLQGAVVSIFDSSNAIHIKAGEKEALRLVLDERVLSVEQDIKTKISSTQSNPGWGLDRMDEYVANTDNAYQYTATGLGRTVYVLDSGLNTTSPGAISEFGGRASVIWDINGTGGEDCQGHGSQVSSIIAGNNFGVAKGATIKMVKITYGCSKQADLSTSINIFNWLAVNAPAGSIVNWSHELGLGDCFRPVQSPKLEQAIRNAHNAGIIVVVAAGNDGCNTSHFSPTNIPEAFVVGATNNFGFPLNDRKSSFSRTGANISTFAPGENVSSMNQYGGHQLSRGTSLAAAYISGTFAVACEAAGTLCDNGNTPFLYSALKHYGGTFGTVTNTNGSPLTGATSRFISVRW